jgi:hypothetical protein
MHEHNIHFYPLLANSALKAIISIVIHSYPFSSFFVPQLDPYYAIEKMSFTESQEELCCKFTLHRRFRRPAAGGHTPRRRNIAREHRASAQDELRFWVGI